MQGAGQRLSRFRSAYTCLFNQKVQGKHLFCRAQGNDRHAAAVLPAAPRHTRRTSRLSQGAGRCLFQFPSMLASILSTMQKEGACVARGRAPTTMLPKRGIVFHRKGISLFFLPARFSQRGGTLFQRLFSPCNTKKRFHQRNGRCSCFTERFILR